MGLRLYVVDAFTDRPFAGNPAAVCVLDGPRSADRMLRIAAEMNLSSTAFLVARPEPNEYDLRWFTPRLEMPLVGHSTLASAHCLWEIQRAKLTDALVFHSASGVLTCRCVDGWISMDFPAIVPEPRDPQPVATALRQTPAFVGFCDDKWLAELPNDQAVRALRPDMRRIGELGGQGLIVTARSSDAKFDFLSRVFAPGVGVPEDPATGLAACLLGPYWGKRLEKTELTGFQASRRTGVMRIGLRGERIELSGQAVLTSRVEFLREP
jgi:PhzF family phenazine biosynthesis protein